MAWIHRDDAVRAVLHLLDDDDARGAYNVTAPGPVTNHEFTDALGDALHRPTVIPLPKFALKLAFGEMGETMLLDGQRATTRRLPDSGFAFKYPTLPEAFGAIFGG
jgi:NAD dependent epimerase/dehydratase family enzyme